MYENPQIREWIDRSRQKIAMALYSLGDDIHPRSISASRNDVSMHEEMTDHALARRRQAVAELMERGRVMEERRRRRHEAQRATEAQNDNVAKPVEQDVLSKDATRAWTTSAEIGASTTPISEQQSNGKPGPVRLHSLQLPSQSQDLLISPEYDNSFETSYEEEMRNAWSMPSIDRPLRPASSHESESLLDLTPSSELAPDPDFSVPQRQSGRNGPRSRSISSHTMSNGDSEYYYAHPDNPLDPIPTDSTGFAQSPQHTAASSVSSVADSVDLVHASDAEEDGDSAFSEIGDGMRTPASAWTDVDSVISG